MDGAAAAPHAGAGAAAPEDTIDLLPAATETGRSMVYLITFSALLPMPMESKTEPKAARRARASDSDWCTVP